MARSLGDLWSYNPDNQKYIVSPEPDVEVIPIDADEDKCLVLASDGLWNVLLEHECIRLIQEMEEPDEVDRDLLNLLITPSGIGFRDPTNPSQALVSFALQRWFSGRLRADNTSVLTLLLDHRGPAHTTIESDETELTDDELRRLASPTVLPQSVHPQEYFISPDHFPQPKDDDDSPCYDDVNLENIPMLTSGQLTYPPRPSLLLENAQNKIQVTSTVDNDNDKYSLLSPAMQSLCELAKRDTNFHAAVVKDDVISSDKTSMESCKWQYNANELQMYVNELPEESFRALSDALKLRNANGNKMHKIINGVKVFRDKDFGSTVLDDIDDDSSCETNVTAKKFRDECVSVTEELVDGHCNGFEAFKEIAEIAKVWCRGRNEADAMAATDDNANDAMHTPAQPQFDPDSTTPFPSTPVKECGFFKRRPRNRKRKLSGASYSPPSKHLRSARWTRGKLTKSLSLLPKNTKCVRQRWRQLTNSLMTTTRLRAKKQQQ